MSKQKIQDFLNEIKLQGKCSPVGQHWNAFFEFLKDSNKTDNSRPPVPLILAASGESPASKQQRLEDQLEWAAKYNILDLAINFLTELKEGQWEKSSEKEWYWESY